MRLIPCSLVLVSVFCGPSPAQYASQANTIGTPIPAIVFPAFQTRMPTKHGDVTRIQSEEQKGPIDPTKIKLDPAQLQREARELLDLSQSLQADIEAVNRGLHPKDTTEKLKRIQKLAKHLREEIAP